MSDDKKDDAAQPNRIMVYLRIRTAKKDEIKPEEGHTQLMELQPDQKTVLLDGGKTYNFDHVFDGPAAHNHEIYRLVGRPVIENIFRGFWGTLLVYGQTGTGKSYTMCNFDRGNEGIIPGAMQDIFQRAETETDRVYTVRFSFIQIYLDKLQDLFNPTRKEELKINRDAKGVGFPGVTERECRSYDEFLEQYNDGHQYRVITATKMNPESSRGHAALFIQVRSVPRDDPSGEERNGKLFMIDLAGYERFSKTGVQEGKMKEEAKTINASLLSLGNVVQALAEKSEHVPWRNAKLTRMLEDAIGGKAKCSIVLTAGPSSEHVHETLGTLYFGSRAMSVKTTAEAVVRIDYKKLSEKLKELLAAAESKISTLEIEAQRRALERDEVEISMQTEWAAMKARQDEQMKKLVETGATADEISKLMAANKQEQELLEEQQYEQRNAMESRHEDEIRAAAERQAQVANEQNESERSGMNSQVAAMQRELNRTKEELERLKTKAKEADSEARRLMSELNDARVTLTKNGIDVTANDDDDLLGAAPSSPTPGAKNLMSNAEMRKEMDRRVAAVKAMLEETHELRLQEIEEPLQEEIQHYKALYEELRAKTDEELQAQKDALTAMYDEEIEEIKRKHNTVQDQLKANHNTIKKSYQKQKDALSAENDELLARIKALEAGGATAAPGASGAAGAVTATRPGVPSLADVVMSKKEGERKIERLEQTIADLEADKKYLQIEKSSLEERLREYDPTADQSTAAKDDRLKPAQVRKLKDDLEAAKEEKDKLEKELFKLRAEQALSGPQRLDDHSDDEAEATANGGDLDAREDMFGDVEGLSVFCDKLLKFPYFMGKEKLNNSHEHILSSLTTDLEDYRRTMRIRIFVMGAQGSGKSSVVKCMTAGSRPLMPSLPDVHPTLHPAIQIGTVDDTASSRTDLHSLYVKFEDVAPPQANQSGLLGRLVGGGGSDPAKIHLDVVDLPGSNRWWRGVQPQFLPGKNACYVVTYNINQPIDAAREDISRQLKVIHAAATRAHSRNLGGDTPRIAVCLIGTHRDSLREGKEAAVVQLLNKITVSLGDTFFKLRGEDTYGMVLIGNFAVSCRDWTVTGGKGSRPPSNFKDLFSFLATTSNRLYDSRPSALIPSTKDSTSHTNYTLQLGDDAELETQTESTSRLNETDKRLRKGIVTLLTALAREVKVRWIMSDSELRELVASHIGLKADTRAAINAVNFICRELVCRGIILMLPHSLYEPKYLPKHKDDCPPDHTPLSRDGVVVLDPLRLLIVYSSFAAPQHFSTVPPEALKDKNATFFDVTGLEKLDKSWQNGIVSQSVVQLTIQRYLPLTANDPKLMLELLSVLGCGYVLRREPAMISPAHFTRPMAPGFIDYLSYLISNHGDGVGRKYKLNTIPSAFVARLQTIMIPFSHVPDKDVASMDLNWVDGSYLVLDKARLKHGIFGSKVLKDAVFNCQFPVRGLMKVEGDFLFVAVTARGPSTPVMLAAVKPILNAIHHHITVLCRREFRGVNASFQEMTIAGCETKRANLPTGIKTILERLAATADEISVQQGAIGGMTSPKGNEIDEALTALPPSLKMDE